MKGAGMLYRGTWRQIQVSMPVSILLLLSVLHLSVARLEAGEAKSLQGGGKAKEAGMGTRGNLTEEEGKDLLLVARKTIQEALLEKKKSERSPSPALESPRYLEKRGTFVTLTIDGALRGCIGHIIPQESLIEGVRINAINAAFHDPRFRPLSNNEFPRVKIEVSILTEPAPLSFSDANDLVMKLRPGIDGVIIKKSFHQATFLPQVWEQLPDKSSFLSHLCMKAGLDGDAWKKERIDVYIYQVQAFEE
jgi:AmmeMemoRadiSam system protein A